VTLWKLPATIEDQFDSQWSKWTERYQEWEGFFEAIRGLRQTDLLAALLSLGVIQESDAAEARKLRRAADNRAVPIPGVRAISDETLSLLAAGFFRGEPGQPAIPYAKIED
jgi:hypothetical protein